MKNNEFTVRADGRLQTSIKSKTGKRIYFYGSSKRELKQKILEYKEKEITGPLFTDVSQAWWEEAEASLSNQSIRGYLQAKNKADNEFNGIYIKEITPLNVNNYLRALAKNYTSQKTIEKYKLILNLIFKYAIEKGYLQSNPCSTTRLPKGLTKSKREAASEREEMIVKAGEYEWLFPLIAIYTGMRKGEILALKWNDIDFENDLIYVTKSIYHDGNTPYVKQPKTEAGIRAVPLLNTLKEKLLEQKASDKTLYLFSDDGKTPLTNKRYETLYNKFKKETGVTCTAHQLRHSFATIAFENGISPKDVQEILGHKQLSTTMDIYTDFRTSHLKKLTEKLNKSFK